MDDIAGPAEEYPFEKKPKLEDVDQEGPKRVTRTVCWTCLRRHKIHDKVHESLIREQHQNGTLDRKFYHATCRTKDAEEKLERGRFKYRVNKASLRKKRREEREPVPQALIKKPPSQAKRIALLEEEIKQKDIKLQEQGVQIWKLLEEKASFLIKGEVQQKKDPKYSDTNFSKASPTIIAPQKQHELFSALHKFINAYVRAEKLKAKHGSDFFERLEAEVFTQPDLLNKVPEVAQRLWTSTQKFPGTDKVLSNIVNDAIRKDDEEQMEYIIILARAIKELCLADLASPQALPFPPNNCVYRGAVIPKKNLEFYTVGKRYRARGFLASSFSESIARQYCQDVWDEHDQAYESVLYVIHIDPFGKYDRTKLCKNANILKKSLNEGDTEYIFTPYSVFTVGIVHISPDPCPTTPHVIHVQAALDSALEPLDLPLAPWA
eukprot:m.86303 g.86303  ORF g.86303 m.86303 type:complete len:435 (+) comp13052_c1_seq2:325-1629(+)